MSEPLSARRERLRRQVLPRLTDPIREAPQFDASLSDLIRAVREQGLEGLVAKRLDSAYEPGQRSGGCPRCHNDHANGYITKPGTSEDLADIVETIERFWIAVAQLPRVARGARRPSRNSGRLIPEDT